MTDPFAPTEAGEYHKFNEIGDTVVGIVDQIDQRQAVNFKTKELEFWKDGTPRMEYVFDVRDIETGEGKRLFVQSYMIKAVREAAKKVGHGPLGHLIKVKLTEIAENGAKYYVAKIEPAPADAAPRKAAAPADPFGGLDEDDSF